MIFSNKVGSPAWKRCKCSIFQWGRQETFQSQNACMWPFHLQSTALFGYQSRQYFLLFILWSCLCSKCPHSIKDMTVEEGWEKSDFLDKVDGKLRLKRSHKYYFQAQGEMGSSGYPKNFFVVLTTEGKPHIEVIMFDSVFWQDMLSKLIVFFKTYMQRVLIAGLFAICAVECEACLVLWCHWGCTGSAVTPDSGFVCQSCSQLALDNSA